MVASKCGPSAALACLLATGFAHAQQRAELTFLLSSGNVLNGAEASPAPWETLEGFRSGRDTRARLALESEQAGLFRDVRTSARLRMDLALASTGMESELRLRDASSSLAVVYRAGPRLELEMRAFPLDTDYVRLGYAHALDWGGTDVARHESVFLRQNGGAPGVALGLFTTRVRLFTWVKSASIDDGSSEPKRAFGGAAGGSVQALPSWRIDAGFGFFQRPPTFLEGASLRLVWHAGVTEPELAPEPFRPAPFRADPERFTADARRGFALALEAVTLVTRQRRYEDPSLATSTLAPAAAFYGSLRERRWAGHFLLSWRSLPFLLKNDPRVLPEQALPASTPSQPELGAWVGGSFDALEGRLVPSVEVGARLPAALLSFSSEGGVRQIFIVGGPAGFDALAPGASRAPVVAARLSVRLQVSVGVALVVSSEYQHDPNRSAFVASPAGVMRRPAPLHSSSQLFAAQARF
ncbi:MAG: hypothetical protein K0R38_3699 [Polyangiaceae bacterium]|jgi:hypothetical protein|nr:hypothetical protein [Polyangiaceae bacterium]